ncbi:Formyltransferase [Fistulina hepatica ATCC 64428]|uniref:Formyltransferase n=1 Tax=Fistulina hepatica ATCC 64428 TaxID=1128425 RepID=A0A0D6ZZC6_9AGAR|nr:Formyltransferase [Fistulina hepatica ATCC 64428]
MGRDEFSCLVFNHLFKACDVWEELHIATQPDQKTGRRGTLLSVSPLRQLGLSSGVPVHLIPNLKPDFKKWRLPEPFSSHPGTPQHLLITASFGRILTDEMLNMFPEGHRLNVHPSLLPEFRGPAPLQHAILLERPRTGVSIVDMTRRSEGVDSGPDLPSDMNFAGLLQLSGEKGGELLVDTLRRMLRGTVVRTPQDESMAKRAPSITRVNALVNFENFEAENIVRLHNAIGHQLFDPVVITNEPEFLSPICGDATLQASTDMLLVRCALQSVVGFPRVKQWGKKLLTASQWWTGIRGLGLPRRGHVRLTTPPLSEIEHLSDW